VKTVAANASSGLRILSVMGFSPYDTDPVQHVLLRKAALLAAVFLSGCQISPRRIVTVNPSPTTSPTPTGFFPSPTPFPSPTVFPTPTPFPSPTPIPTPTAMSTPIEQANAVTEFLYAADPGASTITAYRINGDGTLSPVQGPSFVAPEAPQKLRALDGALLAAGRTTLTVYAVDKANGALQETDSVVLSPVDDFLADGSSSLVYAAASGEIFAYRLAEGRLQPVAGSPFRVSATAQEGTRLGLVSLALDPRRNLLEIISSMAARPGAATTVAAMRRNSDGWLEPSMEGTASPATPPANRLVIDATGKFAYRLDTGSAEIFAYRVEAGRLLSLWPASYPAGQHPASLAVVVP
jgi:hypothetical protein